MNIVLGMTNTLERMYPAAPAQIWERGPPPAGIESWWAPDGFAVEVRKLDLRPGGELVYAMTATAPEQIEFMNNAGPPLPRVSPNTFPELAEPARIAYPSLIDFVPGVEPYEHRTVVS